MSTSLSTAADRSPATSASYIAPTTAPRSLAAGRPATPERGGRLIAEQERERARIARELHDDFGQRMALIQIALEQIRRCYPSDSAAQRKLHEITEMVALMSTDLQELSHQLHPSSLERLGLAAALTGLCETVAARHRLTVRFVQRNVPPSLDAEVALNFFRVAQEALRNVVRHSGVAEARVELAGHGQRLELTIFDPGKGFDPHCTRADGLGLTSMRERLRALRGWLSVTSAPLQGTTIRARAPLGGCRSGR